MADETQAEAPALSLESVLYALSDPIRLHIVRNLAEKGELACYAAVAGLDIAKSTQSHHYRILREAGLIAQRKEGVCFISSLRRNELEARFPGLIGAVLRNFQG
jgi:DNA-binding transcriptional ArsR family regulator